MSSAERENLVKYVQNPSKNPKNEYYVALIIVSSTVLERERGAHPTTWTYVVLLILARGDL